MIPSADMAKTEKLLLRPSWGGEVEELLELIRVPKKCEREEEARER